MNSVIICEGDTDLTLLQYFMEKTNGWSYSSNKKIKIFFKNAKNFSKDGNILTIASTGGCSKIMNCFEKTIEVNINTGDENEAYSNIVIISDRDEVNVIDNFEKQINNIIKDKALTTTSSNIKNDEWIKCSVKNARESIFSFNILLLIIPFEDTGALETFLLNAISENDSYDKLIIEKGNAFVNMVDIDKKYLTKRRYITKAKFDVYFSIRTPLEQFSERRNILRDVNWDEYEVIQESFKKLIELG